MVTARSLTYKLGVEYQGKRDLQQLATDLKSLGEIDSYQKLEQSFIDTNTALVESKNKVRELRSEMKNSGAENFREAYEKARKETQKLTTSLKDQKNKLDASRTALKAQGVDVSNLTSRFNELSTATQRQGQVIAARRTLEVRSWKDIKEEIAGLERAYKSLADSGELSANELAAAQDKLRKKTRLLNEQMEVSRKRFTATNLVMGSLRNTAATLLASFGVYEMAAFTRSVWEAGIASEGLDRSFKAIYGSSQRAQQELDWLRATANELGGDFQTLAKAYVGVAASAQGTKLANEQVRQLITSVIETGTALGASSDQINRALLQMSQGISRGKFELEDLKTIAEALPGVGMGDFADAMGVTTEKFLEMVSKGQVFSEVFLPQLAKNLHEKFGQAAVEAADGAQASMNRLTTAWFTFRTQLAQSGFLDAATEKINQLAAVLKDPTVRHAAITLMNSILAVGEAISRVALLAYSVQTAVRSYLTSHIALILKYASGVAKITDALGITEGAFNKVSEASAFLWDSAKEGYTAAYNGIKKAATGFEDVREEAEKTESTVEKTFANQEKRAAQSFDSMSASASKASSNIQKSLEGVEKKVTEATTVDDKVFQDLALVDGVWVQQEKTIDEAAEKSNKSYDSMAEKADTSAKKMEGSIEGVKEKIVDLTSANKSVSSELELVNGVWVQQQKSIDATKEKVSQVTEEAGELNEAVKEPAKTWEDVWQEAIDSGFDDLDGFEKALQDIVSKNYQTTVSVKVVEAHATGGLAGVAKLANGGLPFPRLSSPLITRGTSMADDVPAMLSRYEYVEPEKAVRYYGVDVMEALRTLSIPREQIRSLLNLRHLRQGGLADVALPRLPVHLAQGGLAAASSNSNVYNLSVNVTGGSTTSSGAREIARTVMSELKKMHRGASS